MAIIIDGKELSNKIKQNIKVQVNSLKKENIIPKLAVIIVGNDSASHIYVKNKSKACNEVGIEFEEYILDENINMEELLDLIERLNHDETVNGILLQSPVPNHLNIEEAFYAISSEKDVDGFNPINIGKLCIGQDGFIPCTPYGIMKMIEEYKIETVGKHVVIIGRSNIVGRPMMQCMLNMDSTVTICHSKTQNLPEITKTADIIIVAVGRKEFITKNMLKEGVVVIDVGINRLDNGKICGDVKYDEVSEIASYITPVPGGVGLMTVAMLLANTVKATKNKHNKN
jgi:methylenetetrahydrofolate dehydrogenase (NADP+)/methenyltetrahydrofolate cyclohydrolase